MNTKYLYTAFAISFITAFFSCSNETSTAKTKVLDSITVSVNTVASNEGNNSLTVSGTVEAADAATLSTRVMGYVDKIHVNLGQKVKRGQLLLSINSSDLKAKSAQVKASITEAEASFNIAKKDYERFKTLFEQNSASQKELDDMTARYTMAQARLNAAKEMRNEIEAQFKYTNIMAPFDGVVAAKFIDAGTMANPGMPLISIESPDNFEVTARIPEQRIADIETGMTVTVYLSSINSEFTGSVTEVSSSSAMSGGQYAVSIQIQNPTRAIRSGMFATVQFPSVLNDQMGISETVRIPKDALIYEGQLRGVYTVSKQNTAVLRWLRLGKTLGNTVEVLSGLSQGETYIQSSEEKLYNGAKLSIK